MTVIKLTLLSSSLPFKCFTISPKNLLSQIPFLRSPVCLKIFIWLLLHFVQRPTPPVPAATLEYLYAPAAGTTFLYGFWRAEDKVVVVDALSLKTPRQGAVRSALSEKMLMWWSPTRRP